MKNKTPATDKWVKDSLLILGQSALDSGNNMYAYKLRQFEQFLPTLAGIIIPLFARSPTLPWWNIK